MAPPDQAPWVPNPNCAWVTVQNAPLEVLPHFAIQRVSYSEGAANGGKINIYVTVRDELGDPLGGIDVVQEWPDGTATERTDRNGKTNFPMSGDSHFNPNKGEVGPYSVYLVKKDCPSAKVMGLGLPLNQHVSYGLDYVVVNAAPPPQTLEEAVMAAAKSVPWMPVNNGAALWEYAKAHGLQDQQTDELKLTFEGQEYTTQVFNLGVVYAVTGDWEHIFVIPK